MRSYFLVAHARGCMSAALLSVAALASCTVVEQPIAQLAAVDIVPANREIPTQLYIDGVEITQAFANEDTVLAALQDLAPADVVLPRDLARAMRELRRYGGGGAQKAPGLTGVAGMFGHAMLDALDDVLVSGRLPRNDKIIVTTSGQITDYQYLPYSEYTPTIGNGRLAVNTFITTEKRNQNTGATVKVKTEAFRYVIRVNNNAFRVYSKDPTDPNNVFPQTSLRIPQAKAGNREYKLWAEGDDIEIVDVFHARNYTDDSDFRRVRRGDPQFGYLYDSDVRSCIDMMFTDHGPHPQYPSLHIPINYGELLGPPFYCLGRCKHPPIINTS